MSHVKRLRPWSKLVGVPSCVMALGHCAEIGVDSRNDDDRGRCAALNAGAHEACVLELDRRICRVGVGIVKLLDRERLAGQRALADEEIFRGQNSDIAWDHVSSR